MRRSSSDPIEFGDLEGEIQAYLEAGIDGFFTDPSDIGVAARDAFAAGACGRSRGNPPAGRLKHHK